MLIQEASRNRQFSFMIVIIYVNFIFIIHYYVICHSLEKISFALSMLFLEVDYISLQLRFANSISIYV
jgi:hypothetical protein